MTKRRDPLSPDATLKLVADRLGWPRTCAIVGRAQRTVRHWSDPDIVTCIRFDAAVELDREFLRLGGDFAPFHCLYEAHLAMGEPGIPGCALAPSRRSAEAAEEAGEAIAAQIRAHLPGATFADAVEAHRDTSEAIVALARTLPDLEAKIAA